jgi:hypothetical protein
MLSPFFFLFFFVFFAFFPFLVSEPDSSRPELSTDKKLISREPRSASAASFAFASKSLAFCLLAGGLEGVSVRNGGSMPKLSSSPAMELEGF